MADMQTPIPGIPEGLLAQRAGVPSKNAAGLQALTQGLFDSQSGQSGPNQLLKQMIQSYATKQFMNQQKNQKNPLMGGMGGTPNPFTQSLGQNTTMLSDPLGLLGPSPSSGGSFMGGAGGQ